MSEEKCSYQPQVGGRHYEKYNIEPIEAMKDWFSKEAFCGYLRGNVIKYVVRYQDKGGVADLEKARWYLNRLITESDNRVKQL